MLSFKKFFCMLWMPVLLLFLPGCVNPFVPLSPLAYDPSFWQGTTDGPNIWFEVNEKKYLEPYLCNAYGQIDWNGSIYEFVVVGNMRQEEGVYFQDAYANEEELFDEITLFGGEGHWKNGQYELILYSEYRSFFDNKYKKLIFEKVNIPEDQIPTTGSSPSSLINTIFSTDRKTTQVAYRRNDSIC